MTDNNKLLTDSVIGDNKTEEMQKQRLADVPAEDVVEETNESGTESDSNSSSDSDSDDEYECKVCDRKFSGYMPFKQHEKGKKHAKMIAKKKMERKLIDREAEGGQSSEGEQNDEHLIPEVYATCKVCAKEFTGPESYLLHKKSKAHKHRVMDFSVLEQVREEGEINEKKLKELYNRRKKAVKDGSKDKSLDVEEKGHEEFECKNCGKVFCGLTPYTQHLTSKTHAKRLENKKIFHEVLPDPSDEDGSSKKTNDGSFINLEDDVLVCKLCCTSFSGPKSAMMHLKSKNHAKKLDKYVRKLERRKEKKEMESFAKKEALDSSELAKEHQPASESSSHDNIPHKSSAGETTKTVTLADRLEEAAVYEKYKKYKELMNSIPKDDVILK